MGLARRSSSGQPTHSQVSSITLILPLTNRLGGNQESDNLSLGQTWPARAKVPVPFAEFAAIVSSGEKGDWKTLVPSALREDQRALDSVVIEPIWQAVQRLDGYHLPIVRIEPLREVEDLGEAFQRVNKQGVPMGQDDLFFSGLKLRWPEAHDLVWDIYRDPEAGRVIKPTRIVHAAVRLTAMGHLAKKEDALSLDLKRFSSLVREHSSAFLEGMKYYLAPGANGSARGRLHDYFSQARKALSYRGDDDPGLPIPLMADLHFRVWHAMVAWIERHGTVDEMSRLEMLRYALLDHFFVNSESTLVTRIPFDQARKAAGIFPGRAIFEQYREEGYLAKTPLMYPDDYRKRLAASDGMPAFSVLQRERDLLLWVQRRSLQRWFPKYDPTRYVREEEKPYDADHLVAQKLTDGRRLAGSASKNFEALRHVVSNNIGNLRYWPRGENRADAERNVKEKHLLGPAKEQVPGGVLDPRWGLHTYGDVRAASAVPEEQVELWGKAATGKDGDHDWSDPGRMEAFREVTDQRRTLMFRELFNASGFKGWLEGSP